MKLRVVSFPALIPGCVGGPGSEAKSSLIPSSNTRLCGRAWE